MLDIVIKAEDMFFENVKVIETRAPKEPLILKKNFVDNFMKVIGEPLGFDLDKKDYSFDS